ncbi:MAG: hypothetical protein KGO21_01570 [Hyphomicrobiales bacterium]|nr:hypothetical protein [Hyphomicrobiales bacterium]
MTSTAILSPPIRGLIADTEIGVPRVQKGETIRDSDQDSSRPDRTAQADKKSAPNATTRRTTIDWETGSVVFRVIDEHSGRTISQSPEEALLRLRAYARQNETNAAMDAEQPTPQGNRTAKTV